MNFSENSIKQVENAEKKLTELFKQIDETALYNQHKVLNAFQQNRVEARHFFGTTGYGYDDIGREKLAKVFADIFRTEDAIVSPLIANGTHALTLMLFGILRPNDLLLSVTGEPYDTLNRVIRGEGNGSLKDFGVSFDKVDLNGDSFDVAAIKEKLIAKPKLVFIQRSRGYSARNALSIKQIGEIINVVRELSPDSVIAVDNCYGEFVEKMEPSEVGADIVLGSLIKNPGGGIAPTGAYIAGKKDLIELIGYRLTSPSLGTEVGSCISGYLPYFQGIFLAPTVVANALKGSSLFGQVYADLGFKTLPAAGKPCYDIIRSIVFDDEKQLLSFCAAIQAASPVDSHLTPEPWDMPGYDCKVVMAAGAFVQGSSIELSADSPIKKPYIAYLQGGLTYEHAKLALLYTLNSIHK